MKAPQLFLCNSGHILHNKTNKRIVSTSDGALDSAQRSPYPTASASSISGMQMPRALTACDLSPHLSLHTSAFALVSACCSFHPPFLPPSPRRPGTPLLALGVRPGQRYSRRWPRHPPLLTRHPARVRRCSGGIRGPFSRRRVALNCHSAGVRLRAAATTAR